MRMRCGGLWGVVTIGAVACTRADSTDEIERRTSALGLCSPLIDHIAVNDDHACVVLANGNVKCWGANDFGQLGDGTTDPATIPVRVPGIPQSNQIVVGTHHTCSRDFRVRCWGSDVHGQLGDGAPIGGFSSDPVTVFGLDSSLGDNTGSTSLAASNTVTCSTNLDLYITCWGSSTWDSEIVNTSAPNITNHFLDSAWMLPQSGPPTCADWISGPSGDHTLRCWGDNSEGQLGDGTTDPIGPRDTFHVPGIGAPAWIGTAATRNCAVRSDGTLKCWGDVSLGALGFGASPVNIDTAGDVIEVASGQGVTCFLRSDGQVQCLQGHTSPRQTVALSGPARHIDLGPHVGCAALQAGGVECWGWPAAAILDVSSPTAVPFCPPDPDAGTDASPPAGDASSDGGAAGDAGGGTDADAEEVTVLPVLLDQGDPCGTDDAACATGFCVDGHCCDNACSRTETTTRCESCETGTCTAKPTTTTCYTRGSLCDSIEASLTCTGAPLCPLPTAWPTNGCVAVSGSTGSLLGGVDSTSPAGGIEITFQTPYTGTIAAHKVFGCPAAAGFDLLPQDTSGDGYYWELTANPPVTGIQMQICVKYDEAWITALDWGDVSVVEPNLLLLHGTSPAGGGDSCDPAGAGWTADHTIAVDTVNNVVCTVATSMSPFSLVSPKKGSLPTLHLPAGVLAEATGPSGAQVTYDATATDPQDGVLVPTCVPASARTFPIGLTPVNCTVVDSDGFSAKASFPVTVQYGAPHDGSFFLQPINADGTSIFKKNSTIPVKFRLTGASAGIKNLVARVYTAKVSNGVTGTFVEADTNAACESGNTFRYDGSQYIYNLSTKSMTTGTWLLRVDLGDGVDHSVKVSLR